MATRIYKDPADFDARQGHFTIEVVDNQYYLRIGALDSEDERLIGSLIDDGFVGFFQDDVRIGIAGIDSTYDAENDRIEIDSELPELQIEDAYIIRFTQARPGEGGEDGKKGVDGVDGIPGRDGKRGVDGEDAEIEVEDTDTGIRVRGKSGGEPKFGPWHDVRDGRDGRDGKKGVDGDDGEDAEIEVEDTNTGIRVRGKSGGEPKFGPWHDVRDGRDGQDGEPGQDGEDGAPGKDGRNGQPAEIEIEDTPANDSEGPGIRVRGKSGGESDFGSWFHVRDGRDGEDGEPGQDGEDGQDGDDGEDAEIEVEDTDTGIRVRGKSGGESAFGPWHDVRDGRDGEDGRDGTSLVLKTRGELIATSSFLPQNLPGSSSGSSSLDSRITWTLNTTNYNDMYPFGDVRGQRGFKEHPSQGRLAIPYRKPADNVNGMWAVTEDLANANENPAVDIEVSDVFIPWGPQQQAYTDNTYFRQRFILQFGYAPTDGYQTGEDVVLQYYKIRRTNYKYEFNLRAFGNTLPSNRCRVKIYLAGVFISTG